MTFQTKPVNTAVFSAPYPRCERCGSLVPGDPWRWKIGGEDYCAICVPLTHFTTPTWEPAEPVERAA